MSHRHIRQTGKSCHLPNREPVAWLGGCPGVGVAMPVGADRVTTAYGANLTLTDVATSRLMWASRVTTPASSDIAAQVGKLVQAGSEAAQQAGFF